MFANCTSQEIEQAVEAGLFEDAVAAHVKNSARNQVWFEKRKPSEMGQHARVGFREKRDVGGRVIGRRVMKRALIGEDGFSAAWFAYEKLDATGREASTKDGVDAADAGGDPSDVGLGRTVFVHGVHVSMPLCPTTSRL